MRIAQFRDKKASNYTKMKAARILFVDDDQDILKLFTVQFCDRFTVLTAGSLSEVKSLFEEKVEPFDLLLCDQHLVNEDGSDIVKYFKDNSPETIRIMVSGYTNFDQLVEAINVGEIYRFISKPWNVEELEQVLSLSLKNKALVDENKQLFTDLQRITGEYELRNCELVIQKDQLSHLLSVLYDIQREPNILRKLDLVVLGITTSKCYRRAVIYLLDEDMEVKAFRYAGLSQEDVHHLLKGKSLTRSQRETFLKKKYRIGNSYFIPYSNGASKLSEDSMIPSNMEYSASEEWDTQDILLIPLYGHNQSLVGLLSVDDPPSGKRPSAQELHIIELFAHEAGLIIEQEEIHNSMIITNQIMENQNIELRGKKMIFYSLLSLNYLTRTTINLEMIIESFKDYLIALFNADTFHLFLRESQDEDFYIKISYVPSQEDKEELDDENTGSIRFSSKNQFIRRLLEEKRPIFINSFEHFGKLRHLFQEWQIDSIFAAPLIYNERILGIMSIGFRKPLNMSLKILEDYELFSNQLASILFQKQLIVQQQEMQRVRYMSTIQALAKAIEKKDPYTRNHCDKVREYSLKIARKISLPSDQTHQLEIASILHDIGKIGISMGILRKTTPLSKDEYETIKKHPEIGEEILDDLPDFENIRSIIRHHQERYDGKGYPDGLKGLQIPVEARVLAIADAYDAMTSDRPYRKALSREDAIKELRLHSGVQWDPDFVDVFIRIIENKITPAYDPQATRALEQSDKQHFSNM